jgi:hypothetical protein
VILSPMPARKITCGECGASEAFPDGDWNEVQRLEIAAWAEAHKLSPSGARGSVGTVPRATADRPADSGPGGAAGAAFSCRSTRSSASLDTSRRASTIRQLSRQRASM